MLYEFNKVAGALASCDHQKSKLRAVAGAEEFWVAELRVRQLKIGSKSYLDTKLGETPNVYDKVAGAGANCDHQNRKLRAVAGAEGFRVAELRVRQLKIGRKSWFEFFH